MPIPIPHQRADATPVRNQDILFSIDRQPRVVDENGVVRALMGLIARQGGSATSWATVGTTSYPLTTFVVQIGAVQWTGVAADAGGVTVTYPTPFIGHPIVFATGINDTSNYVACATDSNGGVSSCAIYWHTTDGSNKTALDIGWIAIGPL